MGPRTKSVEVGGQSSHRVDPVSVLGGGGLKLVDYESLFLRLCGGGIRGLVLIPLGGGLMLRGENQADWKLRDRCWISREVWRRRNVGIPDRYPRT